MFKRNFLVLGVSILVAMVLTAMLFMPGNEANPKIDALSCAKFLGENSYSQSPSEPVSTRFYNLEGEFDSYVKVIDAELVRKGYMMAKKGEYNGLRSVEYYKVTGGQSQHTVRIRVLNARYVKGPGGVIVLSKQIAPDQLSVSIMEKRSN